MLTRPRGTTSRPPSTTGGRGEIFSTNAANCETEPEEGQHYRVAGLNLLAAIIIYWNTLKLGEAVFIRKNAGLDVPAEFLAHASPLGWEHINLTGEYRWPGAGPRST